MRILVAEDDAALASFVKKGLESEHYALVVSSDGEQARAMAGELDFEFVVLDLSLPRLDGVAILRFLRTRKPSMPTLVLTGRPPRGRPGAVSGPGRGRAVGEAVFLYRTVSTHPGLDAAERLARGVGRGGQ
jgi:CheY-like chemotaxis protein